MTRLNDEEIAFFKREGYLIKRGLLDPTLMARAQDQVWVAAPPELDRHNPDTWVGAFAQERFTWKYREPGSEAWMVELLPANPAVWAIAEQLLGEGSLQPPDRVRGIYLVFPEGDTPKRPVRLHVDQHPFHLSAVGYIDDVEPDGGGFTVWPGSHQKFYQDFTTRYTFNPTAEYEADRAFYNSQTPTECHGRAGDVVFWHHRIGHSAGFNRRSRIRQAVLADFKKKDLAETQDLPLASDMWSDWAV
jgi:hypothetical protein